MVNSTLTPGASAAPALLPPAVLQATPAATVEQLFQAAFSVPRDPRSTSYKNGVRAALAFRIEGRRIARLYDPASAEDDAFYAGVAEGHALWRRAQAESLTTK
ncbi:hypothetical protein [Rugamonas apoptosis]|uniref:Uncharacterized protein n=1 Tax=Rugamonas apoptosis TaxID=2758570 RepID=A0A7W2F8A1_9BURK|nr:hypothetical protein [Rugamonas apoptosis]MBA5686963.1 hypothetical protein [Rugamonas apoptosis]